MGKKFGWLQSGQQESGNPGDDASDMGLRVCRPGGQPLAGRELLKWGSRHLEWDIVMRLVDVSTARREHVVVSPLAHMFVGPSRTPMWQQSWKIVSHAAVTFQVNLVVEDATPTILRMRMTQHPPLEFPPLGAELSQMLRRYAGQELLAATADVESLEGKARRYSFRPHLVWEPGKLPEEYLERVYYTTSRELNVSFKREMSALK